MVLFAVVCAMNAGILICLQEKVGRPMVESIPELDEENNIDEIKIDKKEEDKKKNNEEEPKKKIIIRKKKKLMFLIRINKNNLD